MEYLVKLESPVLDFSVQENYIDCLYGKKLKRIEKDSGKILYEKEVFQKEGLARILLADNNKLIISDFCTLNVFNKNNYELIGKWNIGNDLSSDICGMCIDEKKIYCSIRNGKIIKIDRITFKKKEYKVSESSMWSLKKYKDYLVCGTVDGQLLLLDKETLELRKKLELGK